MITAPTNCPSCNSVLEQVNDQLFCRNSNCEAKSSKKLTHFAKTLKIRGLGEKTIEKLELGSIEDIFELTQEYASNKIGDKLAAKLLQEIEEVKKGVSLATFIEAFSIPLVGNSASVKLAKNFSIDSFNQVSYNKCIEAGITDKIARNFSDWVINEYFGRYEFLPITVLSVAEAYSVRQTDYVVCITGKVQGHTRASAEAVLEKEGVKCVKAISKNVTHVITDDTKESSKLTKAKELGIPVVSFADFSKLLGENKL